MLLVRRRARFLKLTRRSKVRPISKRESAGFLQVGCETYGARKPRAHADLAGGGLWHTFLDRDLGLAGRVVTSKGSEGASGPTYTTHLVRIARPILRIPTVAIHLDRTQNEAMKYNTESNMVPILALATKQLNEPAVKPDPDAKVDPLSLAGKHHPQLVQILADELSASTGSTVAPTEIHDFELSTFDCQPAAFGGSSEEFLLSARLDNLFSTYCAIEGLIKSVEGEDALAVDRTTRVTACWDNEEVGSTSAHGAQSNFLEAVLHRLVSVGVTDRTSVAGGAGLHAAIANSFLFSIDMGHACHPSFTEKHEVNLRPRINGGIVIKTKCGLARAERR